MVPMNAVNEILLTDARIALVKKVATLRGRNALEGAFAAWLLPEQVAESTIRNAAQLAAARTGGERTYQDVAVLGFASTVYSLEPDQLGALQAGLQWLAGREPFLYGSPMPFCLDAVALLGIAFGIKNTTEQATKQAVADWIGKFIATSYGMLGGWQKCLLAVAQREANVLPNLSVPSDPALADIRTALYAKALLPKPEQTVVEEDECQTLWLVKADADTRLNHFQAALRLAALDWVRRSAPVIAPNRATISQVSELLRHVPFALRRWTWESKPRTVRREAKARKWHIDHEYHVQNLLWTILAPIFPDLKDEDYSQGVGQKHPRMDICIPSLHLIIEAKFMRATMSPQEVIEEIAADASLYLTGNSNYKNIIAFIWDDARRSEQHEFMIQGLKQLPGVIDAIVISRPSMMVEEVFAPS
jgi:hypothetical protein